MAHRGLIMSPFLSSVLICSPVRPTSAPEAFKALIERKRKLHLHFQSWPGGGAHVIRNGCENLKKISELIPKSDTNGYSSKIRELC